LLFEHLAGDVDHVFAFKGEHAGLSGDGPMRLHRLVAQRCGARARPHCLAGFQSRRIHQPVSAAMARPATHSNSQELVVKLRRSGTPAVD
jgi:hypothetical protein